MKTATTRHRYDLPHQGEKLFITDGGLETTFIFHKNFDLPLFAAFHLLNSRAGIEGLRSYYHSYIDIALHNRLGVVLDTPTWRASTGWGKQLGYTAQEIRSYNELSVSLLEELRDKYATAETPMIINGAVGPQDDGYNPAALLSIDEAVKYHSHQVEALAEAGADMLTAVTMTYVEEAIGITRAAQAAGIPVAVSFTVETDGRLPDSMSLEEAVSAVDAATGGAPEYFMINCAHPSHFDHVLQGEASWTDRIFGIRANASCKSHAELDEAVELDEGNPVEFGQSYGALNRSLKNLRVVGGCCGTDHRHIGEVCRTVLNKKSNPPVAA
jgi:S-methylmethionine-dependent homocysteine/selenocysteine methylase